MMQSSFFLRLKPFWGVGSEDRPDLQGMKCAKLLLSNFRGWIARDGDSLVAGADTFIEHMAAQQPNSLHYRLEIVE